MIEDACQGVGGGYEGRKFGSIGDIGAFSFNYYKNMTAGEGGGVVDLRREPRQAGPLRHRSLPLLLDRPRATTAEALRRQWRPRLGAVGAMLNVQLDRIDGIIAAMRAEKKRIVEAHASGSTISA